MKFSVGDILESVFGSFLHRALVQQKDNHCYRVFWISKSGEKAKIPTTVTKEALEREYVKVIL